MSRDALYRWPQSAYFGRPVPKRKFYEHAALSASARSAFVSDVQRVTWSYKLAESTVRLHASAEVPEIQVFRIQAKGEDVGNEVLRAIDLAVPQPIVFEIVCGESDEARVRMTAAHKTLGAAKPAISGYFTTDWRPDTAPRDPLPPALDLGTLYAALLTPLLPVAVRAGESVSEAIGRIEEARALERAISALQRRMRAERQFNRQVELRRELAVQLAARDALLGGEPPLTALRTTD